MLRLIINSSTNFIDSRKRAADFYNELPIKKQFNAVETTVYIDQNNDPVYVTTIWYTELTQPIQRIQNEHEYIGSTSIDPNDPDWLQKWNTHNTPVTSQEGSGDTKPSNTYQTMDEVLSRA